MSNLSELDPALYPSLGVRPPIVDLADALEIAHLQSYDFRSPLDMYVLMSCELDYDFSRYLYFLEKGVFPLTTLGDAMGMFQNQEDIARYDQVRSEEMTLENLEEFARAATSVLSGMLDFTMLKNSEGEEIVSRFSAYATLCKSGLLQASLPIRELLLRSGYKRVRGVPRRFEEFNHLQSPTEVVDKTLKQLVQQSKFLRYIRERICQSADVPAGVKTYLRGLDGLLLEYDAYAYLLTDTTRRNDAYDLDWVFPASFREDMGANVPQDEKFDLIGLDVRNGVMNRYQIKKTGKAQQLASGVKVMTAETIGCAEDADGSRKKTVRVGKVCDRIFEQLIEAGKIEKPQHELDIIRGGIASLRLLYPEGEAERALFNEMVLGKRRKYEIHIPNAPAFTTQLITGIECIIPQKSTVVKRVI